MSRSARIRMGLLMLVAMAMFPACATQPSKYRKKRGCDCPHWNRLPAEGQGIHAHLAREVPPAETTIGS